MAALNEASIRVTANTAPFQASMRAAADAVRNSAVKMGQAMKPALKNAFDAGKQSLHGFKSELQGVVAHAATLGGALSFGALIHSAENAKKRNIALAASMSGIQRRFVDVAEVQGIVERAADNTAESFEHTRDVMGALTNVSNKIDIEDALKRANLQARRLGLEGKMVADVYGRLAATGVAKTAEEAEAIAEQIAFMAQDVVGISMEEAFQPNDIAEFASFMKRGNMELNTALQFFSLMKGTTKDFGKGIEIVEELGDALNDTKELQAIREAAGMTRDELNSTKGVAENLITVLGKGPKAIKPLMDALGFQARQGLENLLGTEFVDKAIKGTGKIAQGELQEAQNKVRALLEREADYKFDALAAEQRNAELRHASSSRMQEAINKMERAFQSEKMTHAIETVADKLPMLADALASFVSFALENPGTAIAGALAAKAGLAFGSSLVQQAVASGAKSLFTRIMAMQAMTSAPVMKVGMDAAGRMAMNLPTGQLAGVGGAAAAAGSAGIATMVAGATAAGLVGFFGTKSLLEAFGGDKVLEGFGASFAGPGVERAVNRGASNTLVEGAQAWQRGMPGAVAAPPVGSPAAAQAKEVQEAERKLVSSLTRIATHADNAAKGLGNVAKAGTGVGPGSSRGTPHVSQKTGAAPVPQGA